MQKKLHFLKTEEDFSNFKRSRSIVSVNFRIRWHEPKNQNFPRFGFIIPKKTVPLVTDRNLIKRRIKSILTKHVMGFRAVDILFFPKPGTIKLKFRDLETELLETFKKAGIYANS